MTRLKRIFFGFVLVGTLGQMLFAQNPEIDEARRERWEKFSRQNWHKFDFATRKLTKAQIAKLDQDEPDEWDTVTELELLRGVVFGKRGRIFKERQIQDFLAKQSWYKPDPTYTNSVLTKTERENLDLIRLAEAEKHRYIQPGDMRVWQTKHITDDALGTYTAAELSVLIAEVEAIHGKTFAQEEWLQKYFDERYWYRRNPNYSAAVLSEIERKNLEALLAKKSAGRKTAISIGDMGNFQTVALTEDKLQGLTLMELRILRNEIWARRGRRFETPGIRQYFEWRDWYKPLKDQRKVKLGAIEEQNINLILAYEAKLRERLSTEILPDDFADRMFAEDLRILRNEIYARRGRIFKNPEIQKYFESQTWYKPDVDFKDEMLSEIEHRNLAKIKFAEDEAVSKFTVFEG